MARVSPCCSVPARLLLVLCGLVMALCACVPARDRASWRVYALPRQRPGDGLAVVNRPRGEGLHLWLDVSTSATGVCRPSWNPDGARLQGGNGESPWSMGRAPRQEFFQALGHGPVRLALRRQMEQLCREVAPLRTFVWLPPPRSPRELLPEQAPLLEETELLSHPRAVRRAEKQLLGQPLTPADWDDRPLPRPPDGP